VVLTSLAPVVHADIFLYAAEDGGNSDSSLSVFDANVTWGNAFEVVPGFNRLVALRVALAREFPGAGRPLELLVYQDLDLDGDPATFDPGDAVLISRTKTIAIGTPDGEPAEYAIEPVEVSGTFFVAVNMDAFQGEPVFRQDFFEPGDSSWTFYNPVGTPQLDLGASLFIGNNIAFGVGTWVVRAVADGGPSGCNAADLAQPFGVLDLGDVQAFVGAFVAGDPLADLTGEGVLDLADIGVFLSAFGAGCP
jgi:hypothetical protein